MIQTSTLRETIVTVMSSDDTFRPGTRGRKPPVQPFRNIRLTSEIIAMGVLILQKYDDKAFNNRRARCPNLYALLCE
jgi:hypothetical protein